MQLAITGRDRAHAARARVVVTATCCQTPPRGVVTWCGHGVWSRGVVTWCGHVVWSRGGGGGNVARAHCAMVG
eukprot:3884369-Prymnesium_polylepis.1